MTQITEQTTDDVVVEITDEARTVVADALAAEPGSADLALWLEVRGVEAGRFTYDLFFQAAGDAGDDDAAYQVDGITVVVPLGSVSRLQGARLEFSAEGGGGLVMVNPNVPTAQEIAPGVPEEVLAQGVSGPLAVRAIATLDAEVNPSIAGHGGRADLVAMDEVEGIAYLALSGGCQGCAMSRQTLSQGIEVALREALPELTAVVDVTDHAQGANPFYEN